MTLWEPELGRLGAYGNAGPPTLNLILSAVSLSPGELSHSCSGGCSAGPGWGAWACPVVGRRLGGPGPALSPICEMGVTALGSCRQSAGLAFGPFLFEAEPSPHTRSRPMPSPQLRPRVRNSEPQPD